MNYYKMLAERDSEKPAIVEDGKKYTYHELIKLIDDRALSGDFGHIENGVAIIKKDTIMEQLISFMACSKAGYIPMIAPTDAKVLPEIKEVPKDACMAVMTSGTTGVPKILYRTFESWADFFPVQNEIFGIDKDSVLFAQGGLAFTGNLNLYMAQFYAGATMVVENKFNPKRWCRAIKEFNVNTIYLIPTKLMLFTRCKDFKCENIRNILSGSQSLGREDADMLKKVFPNTRIVLYYGASELNYITYITDKDMTDKKNLIGRAFPGVKVSVKNDEIYIDTKYYVEGIKCPCSISDRGYIDEAGLLYFEGRNDDIVGVRGRKVSTMRIENCLRDMEEVEEAAVLLKRCDEKGDNADMLVAYVTLKKGYDAVVSECKKDFATDIKKDIIIAGEIKGQSFFERLRTSLAHYEMPSRIIVIKKMPHTYSGKLDKKGLENA